MFPVHYNYQDKWPVPSNCSTDPPCTQVSCPPCHYNYQDKWNWVWWVPSKCSTDSPCTQAPCPLQLSGQVRLSMSSTMTDVFRLAARVGSAMIAIWHCCCRVLTEVAPASCTESNSWNSQYKYLYDLVWTTWKMLQNLPLAHVHGI